MANIILSDLLKTQKVLTHQSVDKSLQNFADDITFSIDNVAKNIIPLLVEYKYLNLPIENNLYLTGTNYNVSTLQELITALNDAVNYDTITIIGTITINSTITINKSVKLTGSGTIQTFGSSSDPVTMISVTANDVVIDSNLIFAHLKTSNTSVETVFNVNAENFISRATIKFMEFGYILRGSFNISGFMSYEGALGNNHRNIAIYSITNPSLINNVIYDFPVEATPRSSFIYHSSNSNITDLFNSLLIVSNCKQLDATKIMRQFYLLDNLVFSKNPALIFDSNIFNELNGAFGIIGASANVLSSFRFISVSGNIQNNASFNALANKGLLYIDGSAPLKNIGNTKFYFTGNKYNPVNRAANDYSTTLNGALGYKNTAYNSYTAINLEHDTSNVYTTLSEFLNKQDKLISGLNIKTIAGTSLLGKGDISISGASGFVTTSDLNAALSLYIQLSQKGTSFGVGTLDSNGKQPITEVNIPLIQNVRFYTNTSNLPVNGDTTVSDPTKILYVTLDGNVKLFDGTNYKDAVTISSQITNSFNNANTTQAPIAAAIEPIIEAAKSEAMSGTVQIGTWNAATNKTDLNETLPAIPTGLNIGDFYEVTTAGTNLGYTFAVGDQLKVVKNPDGTLKWYKGFIQTEIQDLKHLFVSTIGSNSNSGTSGRKKQSINGAYSIVAQPGTVEVATGSYIENIDHNKQNILLSGVGANGNNSVELVGSITLNNVRLRVKNFLINGGATQCVTWVTAGITHQFEQCSFRSTVDGGAFLAKSTCSGVTTLFNCDFTSATGFASIYLEPVATPSVLNLINCVGVRIVIGSGWTVNVNNMPYIQIISNMGTVVDTNKIIIRQILTTQAELNTLRNNVSSLTDGYYITAFDNPIVGNTAIPVQGQKNDIVLKISGGGATFIAQTCSYTNAPATLNVINGTTFDTYYKYNNLWIKIVPAAGALTPVAINQPIDKITQSGANGLMVLSKNKVYQAFSQSSFSFFSGRGAANISTAYGVDNLSELFILNEENSTVVDSFASFVLNYVLFSNGNLYTWGNNTRGQCGLNSTTPVIFPTLAQTNVTEVYFGNSNTSHSYEDSRLLIKKTDGFIYGTGHNGSGQLGLGNVTNRSTFVQLSWIGQNPKSVFNLGTTYGCVIAQKSDNTVFAAGYNGHGQFGNNSTTSTNSTPINITNFWLPNNNCLIKECLGGFGYYDTVANSSTSLIMLLDDGVNTFVRTCGVNTWGNLGDGTTTQRTSPITPNIGTGRVKEIAGIGGGPLTLSVLKENGDLFCFGYNNHGQVGAGTFTNVLTPVLVKTNIDSLLIKSMASHSYSFFSQNFIKDKDGYLWSCGLNDTNGYCGVGTTSNINVFTRVLLPGKVDKFGYYVSDGSAGKVFLCVNDKGELYCWGFGGARGLFGAHAISIQSPQRVLFGNPDIIQI